MANLQQALKSLKEAKKQQELINKKVAALERSVERIKKHSNTNYVIANGVYMSREDFNTMDFKLF